MVYKTQIESRRAVEALRAGVPNRDAVRVLGSSQHEIEDKFRQQLKSCKEGFIQGKQAEGMLIAGAFGTGKSHLLEYIKHIALEQNFVCSKFAVSKETTLHDPAKILRAAIETAILPDRKTVGFTEIGTKLKFDSPEYGDFYKWVNHPDTLLSSRFAATLFIFERSRNNPEIGDRIIRFWSGDPVGVAELKSWLRELRELATYKIDKIKARELILQRFKFLPRLIVAAGYSGWVLLIDEVELIARYSWRQRAKSYAEIARWIGKLEGISYAGLTTVHTIIPLFEDQVLNDRNDYERIPSKLRASGDESDSLLAAQAERGMGIISNRTNLVPHDSKLLREIYGKVRAIYMTAYSWEPPANFSAFDSAGSISIRQHIKKWINEWDLKRIYPDYVPDTEITELKPDLSEQPEILNSISEESGETGSNSSNI